MEQTTFTKRNNAKRAAERMIAAGTAPSIDYGLREREDGRIEIVWRSTATPDQDTERTVTGDAMLSECLSEATKPSDQPATTEQVEQEIAVATNDADKPAADDQTPHALILEHPDVDEPAATEPEADEPVEENGFGPDPWPPGARVQVALSKRKVRLGTVDYQVDHKYWRVFLDGAPHVSGMYRGDQLSAPGEDAPAPPARAKKERSAHTGPKRISKGAELDAAAARGEMPEKPICTSEANKKQYQPRFDFLAERAAAGDWEAVRKYEVKGINSYAKMVKLYRERLLAANEAQTKAVA